MRQLLLCAVFLCAIDVTRWFHARYNTTPLKVYMKEKKEWTWGKRIVGAFHHWSPPWVEWTSLVSEADVVFVHLYSKDDIVDVESMQREKPLVAFQHGIRFANAPMGLFANVWEQSALTISFQPLDILMTKRKFAFFHMPWGADADKFRPSTTGERKAHVVLVGDHAEDESHGELLFAAAHADIRVRHISHLVSNMCECLSTSSLLCSTTDALRGRRPCDFYDRLDSSDATLIRELQTARFASALRKFEGFEMIGIEALLCGARPLVYDINEWYKDHSIIVPTGLSSDALFDALQVALRRVPDSVDETEMRYLHEKFSWQRIVPTMFERVRKVIAASK